MRLTRWYGGLAIVTALLLFPDGGHAAYLQRGYVIGTGGDPGAGGGRQMLGTVGQPVIGLSTNSARRLSHGYWSFGGSRVVAVDEPPPAAELPVELAFGLPYPNPAPGDVRFALALPTASTVRLHVLDVQGRQVRDVLDERLDPGWLTLGWDGRDASGRAVRPGVYFVRLVVENRLVALRRIVLRR
jgi:hypothetical protein